MRGSGRTMILAVVALASAGAASAAELPTGPLLFHALAPCRVLDTRANGGAIGAGETRAVALWETCGIPGGTRAVYLNVTALGASAPGDLGVWGDASDTPATSVLSFAVVAEAAAGALANLDAGSVSVAPQQMAAGATVHVLLDVAGYFEESGGEDYHGVVPCRIAGSGEGGAWALADGQVRRVPVAGSCQIPEDAHALSAVVSVTQATGAGRLEIYPEGVAPAGTSAISFDAGPIRTTGTIVALGPGGFDVLPAVAGGGTASMTIDVTGYYR